MSKKYANRQSYIGRLGAVQSLTSRIMLMGMGMLAMLAMGSELPIIPWPNQIEVHEGGFSIEGPVTVRFDEDCGDTALVASGLMDMMSVFSSASFEPNSDAAKVVSLKIRDDSSMAAESYRLNITEDAIVIEASDPSGLFYAVQTIRQILPPDSEIREVAESRSLPTLSIEDAPRFEWRGIMLDESRHFFGKEAVMDLLDKMAFYKLNRFHWHLTDCPGWRIEIKQYPKLTTVGGKGDYSDRNLPAQYYTQEQVREIVAYAAERFITIIPEIDMPGHARAANRAYPEFSGGGSGRHPEFTFNPGNPAAIEYLKNILNEVADLFPGPWLHFGGDEVHFANRQWADDPHVQRLMENEGLDNILEVEHFFNRQMAEHINSLGKITGGWDEITEAGLPIDSSLVFWWRHDRTNVRDQAIEMGYDIVICPRIPYYFDFVQHEDHRIGRRWGGNFCPLDAVYAGPPLPKSLTAEQLDQIVGVQACIWTEQIANLPRLQFMTFPRIAAFAESAWTKPEIKDFDLFSVRLMGQLPRYRLWGLTYFNPFGDGWSIVEVSSEHPGYEAARAIDRNPDTFWHTSWSPGHSVHPHSLIIDIGDEADVAGISYLPRMDRPAPDSRIESGRVAVSVDGEEWVDAGEFTFEDLAEDPGRRTFMFSEPISLKYIRITSEACSVGSPHAGAADIDIMDTGGR